MENCHVLSCSWLLQNDYLDWSRGVGAKFGGIIFNNILGDPIYRLSLAFRLVADDELMLYLAQTSQSIILKATPMRFGGVRWWFLCPDCSRRCAKLYLPPRGDFACRLCHDLTYRSCNSNKHTIAGYSISEVKAAVRAKNWFKYPPWRRKRDRRPDYRDRGAWLREIVGDRLLL